MFEYKSQVILHLMVPCSVHTIKYTSIFIYLSSFFLTSRPYNMICIPLYGISYHLGENGRI
jgi:hypothetical protein